MISCCCLCIIQADIATVAYQVLVSHHVTDYTNRWLYFWCVKSSVRQVCQETALPALDRLDGNFPLFLLD